MDAFLDSTGIVALGEMGDKTQIAAVALVHGVAAAIVAVLGLLTLFNVGQLL